jgi:hypothetical protein
MMTCKDQSRVLDEGLLSWSDVSRALLCSI